MNEVKTEPTESLPWHRYGMVWMIILLPLTVVIAALITVVIAMKNPPILIDQNVSSVVKLNIQERA